MNELSCLSKDRNHNYSLKEFSILEDSTIILKILL